MKHLKRSIVLGTVLAMLLIAAVPALAAPRVNTVDIQLVNRTGSSVNVTLNGPDDKQTVFVANGDTEKVSVVASGSYSYRYFACGHTNAGTFTARVGTSITLKKCGGVTFVKIVVDNHTGNPFILSLTGNGVTYGFWIPNGGANISVLAGGYHYTSNACNASGDANGDIKASARATKPIIWKWTCKSVTYSANN